MAQSSLDTRNPFVSGLILAMIGAVSFGINIVFAQMSANAGIHGSVILFYRVFLVLPLAALALVLTNTPLRIEKSETGAIVMMGLTSGAVSLCYIMSVATVPVTVAAVIFYTFPILVVLVQPFVDKTPLRPFRLVIALIAFAGIVAVLGPQGQSLDPTGLLLAGGASLAATVQFFYGARSPQSATIPKLIWIQLLMLPAATLTMLATVGLPPIDILMLAPWASALTILGYAVGFILQLLALNRIAPVVAGLVFCLEPVTASLCANLLLDEQLAASQYMGGVLVLAAIVINIIHDHQKTKAEQTS
jgi:drug/metabolite transporter (DMT)-like permease